jgi:hypothetical protein
MAKNPMVSSEVEHEIRQAAATKLHNAGRTAKKSFPA